MDCVEFVKNIKENTGLLINFFDSTMALYDLVGQFEGLEITNNCTSVELRFIITGDMSNLQYVLKCINNMQITGYTIYRCIAYIDDNHMIIILKEA